MTTATLRAGLVVAAVVLGVFVLSKAFPTGSDDGPRAQPPVPTTPTESPEPTESPPDQMPTPEPGRSPEVQGVPIQVQNGTDETGLAAATAEDLQALGYSIESVGNAPRNYDETTLFFQKGSRLEAEHLRDTFFGGQAVLERIAGDQNPDIRLVVVLGFDYATSGAG